jgi:hypothetical protein
MSDAEEINRLLSLCGPAQREEVFRQLRQEFSIHPLEGEWHTKAEVILEAIHRASDLTRRGIRGVLAEAAFDVEVVEHLEGWQKTPVAGNLPYDFLLSDPVGEVRVQVKLQRSEKHRPKLYKSKSGLYAVETQKTRGGKQKKTGTPTRPYRFGEFDLLAVAMYPSTTQWDTFQYTVADWLLPAPKNPRMIKTLQPVAPQPNDDWTDSFQTAVEWLRSGEKKTVRAQ